VKVLEVDTVSFAYPGQGEVLSNVTFGLEAGSFLAVIGPNGAGKTTLVRLVMGLLPPRCGTVRVAGCDIGRYSRFRLARQAALVRQDAGGVWPFTIAEAVLMGRTSHLRMGGFEREADRDAVRRALEVTGLADLADRPLSQLSAGQRQRAFIARAIAQDTPLVVLDEPTTYLDVRYQVGIFDLLKEMQQGGKTILAVTHDLNLAGQYGDAILLLAGGGRWALGGGDEVLTPERLQEAFGVRVAAVDVGGGRFVTPLGKYGRGYRA